MQDLNCLIVEDESLAADVISDYIHQVPGLKLKGTCENVFAAMEKLRCEKIDLIFLDINLPKINGIDFIKTIPDKYDIVLLNDTHPHRSKLYIIDSSHILMTKTVCGVSFYQRVK